MRTPVFGVRRASSTSGVLPTRSSRDFDVSSLISGAAKGRAPPAGNAPARSAATTGHGGEEDDGLALAHRRVEAVERAHVLALEVDVHERRDLLVPVEELRAEVREAAREVVEDLAHRAARRR